MYSNYVNLFSIIIYATLLYILCNLLMEVKIFYYYYIPVQCFGAGDCWSGLFCWSRRRLERTCLLEPEPVKKLRLCCVTYGFCGSKVAKILNILVQFLQFLRKLKEKMGKFLKMQIILLYFSKLYFFI